MKTEASIKKLEAFEMWLYRRILKDKWTDKISNIKIIHWMNKEKEIAHTIKTSKLQYLDHIMRNPQRYQLLQLVLQGKVMERRRVGRRRISSLENHRFWFYSTTNQLIKAVLNKVMIARVIADG